MDRLTAVTGASALVAGASWAAAALLHSSAPAGCVGAGCGVGDVVRGSTPAVDLVFLLAGVTLAVSLVGLMLRVSRDVGLGPAGLATPVACGAGLVLLLAAGTVTTLGASSWAGMPLLVVSGLLFLVLGLVLGAVTVWRAGLLPRWLSPLLVASVLLLPLANEQTARVLLAVPFGVAWAVLGVALLARQQSRADAAGRAERRARPRPVEAAAGHPR